MPRQEYDKRAEMFCPICHRALLAAVPGLECRLLVLIAPIIFRVDHKPYNEPLKGFSKNSFKTSEENPQRSLDSRAPEAAFKEPSQILRLCQEPLQTPHL